MPTDVQGSWLTLLRLLTCTLRVPIFPTVKSDNLLYIIKIGTHSVHVGSHKKINELS